jgi:hypothetical protein
LASPINGTRRRRQQVLQTLDPQAIGETKRSVEPPQLVRTAEGGHFVHDDVWLGDHHCFHNGGSIQRIGYCGVGFGPTYRVGLGWRAGQAHDGMAGRRKQRHDAASKGAAGTCNENTHVVCLG